MSATITTDAELDALPVGSVIQWPNGCGEFYTLERLPRGWLMPGQRDPQDATDYLPATVLYCPDADLEPQRVQPSREDVVRVLFNLCATPHASFGEQADAILALFAAQPTVAEVRTEAVLNTLSDFWMTPAVQDVAAERASHTARGWTAEHDAKNGPWHLVNLADHYLVYPTHEPRGRSHLVKAASLLVAAIELIDRQAADHG